MKKVLSILMVGVMTLAMFAMSVSAEEEEETEGLTKEEIVDLYNGIVEKTAANNKTVFAKHSFKIKDEADFTGLSGLDLTITKSDYEYYNGVWTEFVELVDSYYNCEDDLPPDETLFFVDYAIFCEERYDKIVFAVCEENSITIFFEESDAESCVQTEYTMAFDNAGNVELINIRQYDEWTEYSSVQGVPFTLSCERIDTYTFVCEKVPVTSIELSANEVKLGYGDSFDISYTIGPENASFKEVYFEVVSDCEETKEDDVVRAFENEEVIRIYEMREGNATVKVYTYSGDLLATCEVTVEYTIWEKVISIFDEIIDLFVRIFLWWL